jgi:hypothetical protein
MPRIGVEREREGGRNKKREEIEGPRGREREKER